MHIKLQGVPILGWEAPVMASGFIARLELLEMKHCFKIKIHI